MQATLTLLSIAAALFFSLACAVFLEELIFGMLFKMFFAGRMQTAENKQLSFSQLTSQPVSTVAGSTKR